MENKKILVLGATGAMAVYLIPELVSRGYLVDGVSLDDVNSELEGVRYIKANAKDVGFVTDILKNGYDAVVDFMIYNSAEDFNNYYKLYLENTKHYIFLSTCRVYADDSPLHEGALRILDSELPEDFVKDREYSIYKALGENMLRSSDYKNYTIIRPAITYSKRRFQLTTLEANVLIYRMLKGKTVVLPEGAMDKQATMSWAGDVAKMIAGIVLNEKAYCETYNVATAEHMTWREVAEIYREIGGLKYITAPNNTYADMISPNNPWVRQQLEYDRCFNRIVDNSKILALCGMKQSDLMTLHDGLAKEFAGITLETCGYQEETNARMDEYLESIGIKE